MAFWRCYYHIVWATKNREPMITPAIETVIFDCIRAKSAELESPLLAMNGVSDHVHVAVSISPKVAVAEWIKRIKGASSYEVNGRFPNLDARFRWQNSYGVHTFGAKNLPFVVQYIERQKEHHAAGTAESYLEQMDD